MHAFKPKSGKIFLAFFCIIAIITLASWTIPMTSGIFKDYLYTDYDTLPNCRDKKLAHLDDALQKLNNVKAELNDRDIAKEVAAAMQKIDMSKIKDEVAIAMERANIALKNVDEVAIKKQVEDAIAKIDMDKLHEQIQIATANLQPQIEQSLKEAGAQIDKATREIEKAKGKIKSEKD